MKVEDDPIAISDVAILTLHILAQPCANGTSCTGPLTDINCTSLNRTTGEFEELIVGLAMESWITSFS